MSSTRCLVRPMREVALRPRIQISNPKVILTQTRFNSNDQKVSQVPEGTKGPNEDQLPHVSEEQAAMDKAMGNTPPDISQGTPVQDILKRDPEAADAAPQVIKDKIQNQKRSYSTSARRLVESRPVSSESPLASIFDYFGRQIPSEFANSNAKVDSVLTRDGTIQGQSYPDAGIGHKFRLLQPSDLSRLDSLRKRYDPVVDQLTKSIMKHGKLSAAQRHVEEILTILRTAPAPVANAAFPQRRLLLSDMGSSMTAAQSYLSSSMASNSLTSQNSAISVPTSLPRATLPLHPIEYLTTIIDSISPLVKIRQQRGMAGGGASVPMPKPLGVRQRRRQAIQWILSAAENRKEIKLSDRIAKELLRIADGSSGVWDKRAQVHRLAVSARSNVRASMNGRRR